LGVINDGEIPAYEDAEVIELLDRFINEWIEHYKKHLIEYKSLTGWILLDSVKRRFLDI
jgi:hypothetical protein